MYLQCLDEDKYESAVLGGWSVACVYVCVIYELLSSQLSTRVKFTYINSKKKVNIHSNGNCKPGANSLWFNSFTLEISLTFLGQTVSHLEIHTFMAREKAERCSFHLRFPPPPKSAFERLGSWGFLKGRIPLVCVPLWSSGDPQMLNSFSSEGRKTSRPSASDHRPCWWIGGRLMYQRSEAHSQIASTTVNPF